MEFNATFLVSAISFIVFAFIMNAIFYKPLQKIVQEREEFIAKTNDETKMNFDKSENILKEKEEKLETTRSDAKKIISNKSDEMKQQKEAQTKEAQAVAAQKISEAKNNLQNEKQNAQNELSDYAKSIASDISSKILG